MIQTFCYHGNVTSHFIVFSFSWGHFNSRGKLKTMFMPNFGVTIRVLWYVMVFSVVVNCKPLEWNATRFQLLLDFPRFIDETFSVLYGAYFFVPFSYWHVKAEKNINSFFGWESNVEAELTPSTKKNQMILMNPLLNRRLKLNTPIPIPEKKTDFAWKWVLIALPRKFKQLLWRKIKSILLQRTFLALPYWRRDRKIEVLVKMPPYKSKWW